MQAGVVKLFGKLLAENDNSKNQVYFGPGFQALNLFPNEGIVPDSSATHPIFKAKLRFGWLQANGGVVPAPGAQLILYPQYPEVRFSGFLKGCADPPSKLMAARIAGRILLLGVTADRRVIGFVAAASSEIASEFESLHPSPQTGVIFSLGLPLIPDETNSRAKLLAELRRISALGWISSKQLDSEGTLKPCVASHCGGLTLEAELGISKNSIADPDYLGWEVKQHTVTNFSRAYSAAPITLMTPEPTGGFYKTQGVEAFIRKFGYPDKNGKPDRFNFGGVHRTGARQASTGLELQLVGYDSARGKITDSGGSVVLVNDAGEVAAAWEFNGLLGHWSHKHSLAVYVPAMRRMRPTRQYAYGARVRLAQRTDPLRFLAALASGSVYYDPGIKLENASSKPVVKRRSQFRIASKHIAELYNSLDEVDV